MKASSDFIREDQSVSRSSEGGIELGGATEDSTSAKGDMGGDGYGKVSHGINDDNDDVESDKEVQLSIPRDGWKGRSSMINIFFFFWVYVGFFL